MGSCQPPPAQPNMPSPVAASVLAALTTSVIDGVPAAVLGQPFFLQTQSAPLFPPFVIHARIVPVLIKALDDAALDITTLASSLWRPSCSHSRFSSSSTTARPPPHGDELDHRSTVVFGPRVAWRAPPHRVDGVAPAPLRRRLLPRRRPGLCRRPPRLQPERRLLPPADSPPRAGPCLTTNHHNTVSLIRTGLCEPPPLRRAAQHRRRPARLRPPLC